MLTKSFHPFYSGRLFVFRSSVRAFLGSCFSLHRCCLAEADQSCVQHCAHTEPKLYQPCAQCFTASGLFPSCKYQLSAENGVCFSHDHIPYLQLERYQFTGNSHHSSSYLPGCTIICAQLCCGNACLHEERPRQPVPNVHICILSH